MGTGPKNLLVPYQYILADCQPAFGIGRSYEKIHGYLKCYSWQDDKAKEGLITD